MRILPINFNYNYKNITKRKEVEQNSSENSRNFVNNSYFQPAFTSTSLFQQYRKLQGKMPARVEELMFENVKIMKNPKLLNDIHDEAYAALGKCETLAQIKELFPEFAEVKEVPCDYDKSLQFLMGKINDDGMCDTFQDFVVRAIKNLYLDFKSTQDSDAWLGLSYSVVRKIIAELNIPQLERSYLNTYKGSLKELRTRRSAKMYDMISKDPEFQINASKASNTSECLKKRSESNKWIREVNPEYVQKVKDYFADPQNRQLASERSKQYSAIPQVVQKRSIAARNAKRDERGKFSK